MAIVYDFPQVRVFNDNRYDYWIEIMTMSCQMSISSAYRMYEEANQENNKLLHEISKQLQNQGMTLDQVLEQNKSNGDKLDQIIEGTVVPSAPVGSDKVEDLGELEDGLMDSAQDGLDQADTIFNSAPGIVALYATGFLFMSSVIEHVASAGWISGIITVSLALGLLGFIANIAVAVVRGRSGGSGKGGKT